MARAKSNKLYRTFTKGLITEASPLTYPEDASIDELNTVISRKGNRTRRVGLDYQSGYAFEDLGISNGKVVNEFVWLSANNNPLKSFLVVQVGTMLYFYTIGEGPISANLHPKTFNLLTYKIPTATGNQLYKEFVSFSAGAGMLFVAHRFCDPLVIEYKEDTDTFEATRVVIQIRDFEGVNDGLPNDAEPKTLSKEHHYNLRNQGWIRSGSAGTVPAGGAVFPSTEGTFGNVVTWWDPFTGELVTYGQNGDVSPIFGNTPDTQEN